MSLTDDSNMVMPVSPMGNGNAVVIDGEVDPSSIMTSNVTVVGTPDNVGADVIVTVPAVCGCSAVSVRNVSTIPIEVQNANIVFQ